MEDLPYVCREQVGGAAGVRRSEQPDNSKMEESVSVCVCVKREQVPQHENCPRGTSLVAQWLRVCLPMQGTRV